MKIMNKITSNTGHMLDLVFSEVDKDLILGVEVHDMCYFSSTHGH